MTSTETGRRIVRIGGGSAFWGDSEIGPHQLVHSGAVDYVVFDYLAELTMSILAAARQKDPALGYATDFVEQTLPAILPEALTRGVRLVCNAGGINPLGCAAAARAVSERLGLAPRIAVVTGDDVLHLQDRFVPLDDASPPREARKLLTASAYLGAAPIRAALDRGADIVITGRCVDSALTLGILQHAFGWRDDDYDLLASGSLAGHIIECGPQATGGLHTDWRDVPDWAHIGYPIVACEADGTVTVTKPAGTGGLVTPGAVAEQILYEIGDPGSYRLPDVACDLRHVTLRQVGPDRVRVTGARGRAPGAHYKVSATYADGYKCVAQLTVIGDEAVAKARRTGEALLERINERLALRAWPPIVEACTEILGSESSFGAHSRAQAAREVVMRLSVRHPRREALELFAREIAAPGTSFAPGTTGLDRRPRPSSVIKLASWLIAKEAVSAVVHDDGGTFAVGAASSPPLAGSPAEPAGPTADPGPEAVEVPLFRVALARSGDKGDISNIGVIARWPGVLPYLRHALTPERVRAFLGHAVKGRVTRFEVPGLDALNFVCEEALDGGGMASLRNDALGKAMAQILLSMPVKVPPAWSGEDRRPGSA
ncbi:acyclic terpene utilization AtuA family protein [uncultured Alsobacter sp.]|uniref:acyclic terpene utilization AtuA family protein n=1 Tax=uncultured Alsobacter sp. TaxID=1748258 RepID=UPI0025D9D14E|nr:acyclic terpene utilization AtuA family protein [uncultured Alsobacter sp.]